MKPINERLDCRQWAEGLGLTVEELVEKWKVYKDSWPVDDHRRAGCEIPSIEEGHFRIFVGALERELKKHKHKPTDPGPKVDE